MKSGTCECSGNDDGKKEKGPALDLVSGYLMFAVHAVGAAGVVLLTYTGTRQLAVGFPRRSSLLLLLSGFLIAAFLAGKSIWVSRVMESTLEGFTPHAVPELPANWGNELSPADREKKSRVLASVLFRESGSLRRYVTKEGEWRIYTPTAEDLSNLEEAIKFKTQMQSLVDDGIESAWKWLSLAASGSLIGWYMGRKEKAGTAAKASL